MSEASRSRQAERNQSKVSSLAKTTFVSGAILCASAGAIGHYAWKNTSLFDNYRTPTFQETQKRPERGQAFFDSIVKEVSLTNTSGVYYDPKREKMRHYVLSLKRKNENDLSFEALRRSSLDDVSYSLFVGNHLDTIGSGNKPPIFVGDLFFVDPHYSNYSRNDLKIILKKGDIHARLYASGLDGINSTWLIEQINRNNIPFEVLSAVDDIVGLSYCLRTDKKDLPLSSTCRRDVESMLKNSFASIFINYIKASPETKQLIKVVFEKEEIKFDFNIERNLPTKETSEQMKKPSRFF